MSELTAKAPSRMPSLRGPGGPLVADLHGQVLPSGEVDARRWTVPHRLALHAHGPALFALMILGWPALDPVVLPDDGASSFGSAVAAQAGVLLALLLFVFAGFAALLTWRGGVLTIDPEQRVLTRVGMPRWGRPRQTWGMAQITSITAVPGVLFSDGVRVVVGGRRLLARVPAGAGPEVASSLRAVVLAGAHAPELDRHDGVARPSVLSTLVPGAWRGPVDPATHTLNVGTWTSPHRLRLHSYQPWFLVLLVAQLVDDSGRFLVPVTVLAYLAVLARRGGRITIDPAQQTITRRLLRHSPGRTWRISEIRVVSVASSTLLSGGVRLRIGRRRFLVRVPHGTAETFADSLRALPSAANVDPGSTGGGRG